MLHVGVALSVEGTGCTPLPKKIVIPNATIYCNPMYPFDYDVCLMTRLFLSSLDSGNSELSASGILWGLEMGKEPGPKLWGLCPPPSPKSN